MDDEHKEQEDYLEDESRRDMGVSLKKLGKRESIKRVLFEFLYNPYFELFIFALIIGSVSLLVIEVLQPDGHHTGWMAQLDAFSGEQLNATVFFWLDVTFTLIFAVEYGLKLWIAPRKWFFVRTNIIDLLAILPILRVFRLGRAVRLLRLLRLLRLIRIGQYLQQYVDAISRRMSTRSVENEIIFVYLAFSLVFGTVGILVFEKGENKGFNTLGDGLWWCVVTLTTVGYGDLSPQTTGGKVVAGIIMFVGLTFWALLTGTVSAIIIEHAKKNEAESIVISSLSQHVVICGWNSTGERLVRDLVVADPDLHIVIVQQESDIPRMVDGSVHYLIEDPTTSNGLEKSRMANAKVAVVLADTRGDRAEQDVDARSILTALAIERANPSVHSIVELLSEENLFHVRNASVDEVIIAGQYLGTMLSQSVQFPGLSDVFGSLFGVGEGVMLREVVVPGDQVGGSFADVGRTCVEKGLGVLLGYRRGGALRMTPPAGDALQATDVLILMRSVRT